MPALKEIIINIKAVAVKTPMTSTRMGELFLEVGMVVLNLLKFVDLILSSLNHLANLPKWYRKVLMMIS